MKYTIFFIFLFLIPWHIFAADFSEAKGFSPNGSYVVIDGETLEVLPNGMANNQYGIADADDPLNLGKVCDYTAYSTKFTCKKMRGSPLSGATYLVTFSRKKKDGCGSYYRIFLCIKDCSYVPKIFYVDPWEC